MNDVLYHLCRHCVGVMDGWYPFPSTAIAKLCGKSLYQTRKELKRLKDQGLVVSDRYVNIDPEQERPLLINGYTVTEKAKETEEYRAAFQEERKVCMEIFGMDIGSEPIKWEEL